MAVDVAADLDHLGLEIENSGADVEGLEALALHGGLPRAMMWSHLFASVARHFLSPGTRSALANPQAMDAFVDKVKAPERPVRVVSLRSLDSIGLARLRSTLRYLTRQRDEQLRLLGREAWRALQALGEGPLERAILREHAEAVTELEKHLADAERQLQRAQMAGRLISRGASPFLTVCPCGAPLLPDDLTCPVCRRDVEDLVRLAAESKSRVATIPCSCGVPLVSGIRFCPDCGRNVVDLLGGDRAETSRCGECGEAASPGDRFCSGCGQPLG
jgi:hypothetical protein